MIQILVIEDDSTQRLLTCSVLRSAGYEVTEAVNGSEGLSMARTTPPDLIVCDVMMPGLNGYELVIALKSDAEMATIPVILLTAMSKRSHVRIGMTSGADDYLYKPFRATELRQSVEALLAKRKLQRKHFERVGKTSIFAALEFQKEQLGMRYEKRLTHEINDRWSGQAEPDAELTYFNAALVFVNLFEIIQRQLPADKLLGQAVQRVYQAASDSLYLFGARHLVVMGGDLLAIFPEPEQPDEGKTRLQALKSAFGMQRMVRAAFESIRDDSVGAMTDDASLTIALHVGKVAVLELKDPLHSSQSITIAVGQAVHRVKEISHQAQSCHWRVICSSAVTDGLEDWVAMGTSSTLLTASENSAIKVTELLAVAQS